MSNSVVAHTIQLRLVKALSFEKLTYCQLIGRASFEKLHSSLQGQSSHFVSGFDECLCSFTCIHSAEREVQKTEDVMKQSNKQIRRNQEDKERARQIDGILHSVIQSVSGSHYFCWLT